MQYPGYVYLKLLGNEQDVQKMYNMSLIVKVSEVYTCLNVLYIGLKDISIMLG